MSISNFWYSLFRDRPTQQTNQMTPEFTTFTTKFVIPHEAVYAKGHYGDNNYIIVENVEGDAGGLTYAGIDKASHPNFDYVHPTVDKAIAAYWIDFVDCGCKALAIPLCWVYFDCCVNNGLSASKKLLAQTNDPHKFNDLRIARYHSIVDNHPNDVKFLRGWLNRVADLNTYLKLS